MIQYCSGNIFDCHAQVLVNPVNCSGASGDELTQKFKDRYPENYKAYRQACFKDLVKIGTGFSYDLGEGNFPRYVFNLPTKITWATPSNLDYIRQGLNWLLKTVEEYKITSVALPALGTGVGHLPLSRVMILMELKLNPQVFMGMNDTMTYYVYLPQ